MLTQTSRHPRGEGVILASPRWGWTLNRQYTWLERWHSLFILRFAAD